MLEVFQDGERFFPCLAGLLAMPGGVMNIAGVAERLGLAPPVTDLPVQVEGAVVTGNRFGMVAEVVVRVPQAVQGGSLQLWVAKRLTLVQLERLPAVDERLPVIAEHGVEPAHRVQGDGLARPVTSGGEQLQRLPGMIQRLTG